MNFRNKAANEFYLCFAICFSIFFINEIYNEKLFNLNYDSFKNIINYKMKLIGSQFYISKIHIKIFFSIFFGLNSGIFLRTVQRGAYFDNLFCNFSNSTNSPLLGPLKHDSSEKKEKSRIKLEYMIKIKSLINLFISNNIIRSFI